MDGVCFDVRCVVDPDQIGWEHIIEYLDVLALNTTALKTMDACFVVNVSRLFDVLHLSKVQLAKTAITAKRRERPASTTARSEISKLFGKNKTRNRTTTQTQTDMYVCMRMCVCAFVRVDMSLGVCWGD
jgi:hypothetical protein